MSNKADNLLTAAKSALEVLRQTDEYKEFALLEKAIYEFEQAVEDNPISPILLQIRAEAERLLLSYQNKVIIPPDKIGSQWDKLKELLEASK